VFIIEYAGPIIIHLLFPLIRPYVYKNAGAMSPAQWASSVMMILHFLKREFETEFVHHFSAATMPRFNVLKNSAHYWLAGGLNIAYWVYSPTSMAAKSESSQLLILGLTLFSFGELLNLYTHLVLSRLRTPGGTERGIPQGFGFNLVTCPNYLFETIAWMGILLVTQSISTLLFVGLAVYQMQEWAEDKEVRYRKEFGNKYQSKTYPMIPGIPILNRRKLKKVTS
jgi:very-long-chain enoyl-CoA reductase